MTVKSEARRLITLASNPTLTKGEGGVDDWQDELDEAGVEKGKTVSGPRTKLASADLQTNDVAALVKSVQTLAKSVTTLVKNQATIDARTRLIAKALEEDVFAEEEEVDPFDDGDDFGGFENDTLSLSNSGDASDIHASESGGGEDMQGEPRDFSTSTNDYKDAALSNARMAKAKQVVAKGKADGRVAKASAGRTVRKDDAATSFGEKDDNVPGNRPFDQNERDEDATVIQGGPGAGPGPVNKALLKSIVQEALADAGVISKSVGPAIGASRISKGAGAPSWDIEKMKSDTAARSFAEINRFRAESGDLGIVR